MMQKVRKGLLINHPKRNRFAGKAQNAGVSVQITAITMIKQFLKRLRDFWAGATVDSVSRPHYKHRNIDEYENKRMLEDPLYLDRYGYKVYSEADEDGIIAEIFKRIGISNKTFVDFGI